LPGLFLAEIDRDGVSMPAVSPREVLLAGDRLLFVGVVESVVELQKIHGLVPATEDVFHLQAPRPQRCLIEAVVSNSSPLLGKSIRDSRFRSHYNAVVVAVARNGQRLREKIGDIILHAGDVVLVEAHPSFADQHRNSRDFYLVSTIEGSNPPRHNLALVAVSAVRLDLHRSQSRQLGAVADDCRFIRPRDGFGADWRGGNDRKLGGRTGGRKPLAIACRDLCRHPPGHRADLQ
jgi:K+/H+ antiporter YhaU regulatory subunit KhtT